MTDSIKLLETAQHAAREAGKAIMDHYLSGVYSTEIKMEGSPVTSADRNAHSIISKYLRNTNLPVLSEEGISVDYYERKKWEYFWLIDPLDGTEEFKKKIGEFTVNIALIYQCIPVAGVIYVPSNDVMYFGSKETGVFKNDRGRLIQFHPLENRRKFDEILQKDQLTIATSRSHLSPGTKDFISHFKNTTLISLGSSLKFMLLLENLADIYPRLSPTMEWDTAAAHAILNASNRGVYLIDLKSELVYNKENLRNPFFIAF